MIIAIHQAEPALDLLFNYRPESWCVIMDEGIETMDEPFSQDGII